MPSYTTADIRNLALMGAAGSGKTMLTEALLKEAGVIGAAGSIDRGDTVSDYTDEEKEHGHSLMGSIVHADYDGCHLNLLDTPGMGDFMGHAIAVMPAVETAIIVVDAVAGIDSTARRLMQRAKDRNLCRMIVINKVDHANIDLPGLVDSIKEVFGSECLPLNLPADGGKRIVDCFFNPDGDSDLGSVRDAHTAIVDQVVEVDEKLMEVYLEQGEVKPDQLHEPFEKALRQGHLVPVCFTAAAPVEGESVGIAELLKILVKLAPSPLEGNPRPFFKEGHADVEIHAEADENKHVLAHVFQIRIDAFVGKMSMFRIHQGKVTKDSQLYIDDPRKGESKKPFKVGHLFKLQGAKHVEIDAAIPGDIAAVAKVDEIHFDAVLHDSHDEDGIHLKPLSFPEPMQGLAITPTKRGDEQKIADALTRFQEEDRCFKVTRDNVTHETVIHGLGELHLRIMLERLRKRYNIEVETKPPKIAYRETVQGPAEGHHRHKKQTGGAGQFGEVYLRIEPLPRDSGFEFVNDTFGGSIPAQFIPAVEKGVRQVLEEGAVAGYPIQDVKVSVYDGKHHPVDSKEIAFITAAKKAFIDAVQKARPALLEPMVNLEVTVPGQYVGTITGDLSGKRGRILGTDMLPGDQTLIKALVPLAEVMNYQSQLKSVTGGQGSFTMELDHYEPVPGNVAKGIIDQFKPRADED